MLTHREHFYKTHNLPLSEAYSLPQLSKIAGVPLRYLEESRDRGYGAYHNNPQSVRMKGTFKKNVNAPMSQKLSKEQWARARVFSFLDGGKADLDLQAKVQKK